jgi:hypothetical protein
MTPPNAISIDAGSEQVGPIATAAAGKADAAGHGGLFSTIAGTKAGGASDDGAEPLAASRNRARQPNSCCGPRP